MIISRAAIDRIARSPRASRATVGELLQAANARQAERTARRQFFTLAVILAALLFLLQHLT